MSTHRRTTVVVWLTVDGLENERATTDPLRGPTHAKQRKGHSGSSGSVSSASRSSPHSRSKHTTRGRINTPWLSHTLDSATHIRMFLNVWNVNHMAQRLPEEEAHQSKTTEFGLMLDGRAAFWHSQMDLPAIKTFDALQSAFLWFFHKKVPQHVIIGQFYTIKQLPSESIASLRF